MKALLSLFLLGIVAPLLAAESQPASDVGRAAAIIADGAADVPAGYVQLRADGRTTEDLAREQTEVKRLKAQGKLQLVMTDADLTEVVRFIADKCDMNYMVMPNTGGPKTPVTINSYGNPWELLNLVSDLYNVGFLYNRGVWVFYHLNPSDLFGRTYALKNNPAKSYDGNGAGGSGSKGTASDTKTSSTSSNSAGTGAGSSTGGSMGTDTASKVFSVDSSQVEATIKEFLGLPSNGFKAGTQGTANPGNFPAPSKPLPGLVEAGDAGGTGKGLVSYLKDSNSLYIVATRQQHLWIDQYLTNLDKPKALVELEIKFIETSHDPQSALGVDWSGAFSDVSLNLTGLKNQIDLNRIKDFRAPSTAILSASDLNVRLRALSTDDRSTAVQYPRMVTVSGQEVVMRSVVQRPVLQSTSTVTSGTSTSQNSVQYLDIGTIVNILPERLDGDNVLLNVSMSISSIIGTTSIGGNDYPIPSRRSFTYQVIVKSGFSLAVGGLEEALDQTSVNALPGLGRIPFFGYFFSEHARSRSRRNLMMFVTPKILSGYDDGGIAASPMSTIPQHGPRPPRRTLENGGANASVADIKAAATDLREDIQEVLVKANEGRVTAADMTMLDVAGNELKLMDLRLAELGHMGERVADAAKDIGETRQFLATSTRLIKEKNAHLDL